MTNVDATYLEDEWNKMVSEAEAQLKGDCPLLEDEVIVYINEKLKELQKKET